MVALVVGAMLGVACLGRWTDEEGKIVSTARQDDAMDIICIFVNLAALARCLLYPRSSGLHA